MEDKKECCYFCKHPLPHLWWFKGLLALVILLVVFCLGVAVGKSGAWHERSFYRGMPMMNNWNNFQGQRNFRQGVRNQVPVFPQQEQQKEPVEGSVQQQGPTQPPVQNNEPVPGNVN